MKITRIRTKIQPSAPPGSFGFTLVEILVAMTLLIVAFLGVASVTAMVLQSNHLSRTITEATTLANDRMEELKDLPWNDPKLISGTVPVTSNLTTYTRQTTVTPNSPGPNMTTIEVRVNWTWRGTAQNVTIRNITAR